MGKAALKTVNISGIVPSKTDEPVHLQCDSTLKARSLSYNIFNYPLLFRLCPFYCCAGSNADDDDNEVQN